MAISYSDLVNKGGTIYNSKTGQGFPTPQALATALGVPVASIQWGNIQSNPNYNPGASSTQQPKPSTQQAPASTTQQPAAGKTQTPPAGQLQYADADAVAAQGGGYMGMIGTRPSPANPQVTEYYDKATGQGFSSPQALADFVNKTFPGSNANASNVFSLVQGQYNPPPAGVDPALWAQADPATQAFLKSTNQLLQSQFNQGMSNVSISSDLLNKALESAKNDPNIVAKYGDASKIALADLQNNLGYINAEYGQQMGLTTRQQELDRKALAEQYAGLGQAQSGFRNQAADFQKQQQQAVIQSSQRQLQQQVRSLGSQYESQFGTKALPGNISAGGQDYQKYGGITGSVPIQKQQDIQNRQQQIYSQEQSPLA